MSSLDIKDSTKRATLVKEYVTAMKTVKQRNGESGNEAGEWG